MLLLARGRSVSKDVLADTLWDANPPKNVSGTIEQHVSLLRRGCPTGRTRRSA